MEIGESPYTNSVKGIKNWSASHILFFFCVSPKIHFVLFSLVCFCIFTTFGLVDELNINELRDAFQSFKNKNELILLI